MRINRNQTSLLRIIYEEKETEKQKAAALRNADGSINPVKMSPKGSSVQTINFHVTKRETQPFSASQNVQHLLLSRDFQSVGAPRLSDPLRGHGPVHLV